MKFTRKHLLFLLPLPFLLIFGIFSFQHYQLHQQLLTTRKTNLQTSTQKLQTELKSYMVHLEKAAAVVEKQFEEALSGPTQMKKRAIIKLLSKSLSNTPEMLGIAIMFDKNMYKGQEFFAPYRIRLEDGSQTTRDLQDNWSDYTNEPWFKEPLTKGPLWNKPFFGNASREPIMTYALPLEVNGVAIGILSIALPIKDLVHNFDQNLESQDHSFIFTSEGLTIFGSKQFSEIASLAKEHQDAFYQGSYLKHPCIFYSGFLPELDFYVVTMTAIRDVFFAPEYYASYRNVLISLVMLLLSICTTYALTKVKFNAWIFSMAITFSFCLGITLFWISYRNYKSPISNGIPINDRSSVSQYKNKIIAPMTPNQLSHSTFIPTGFQINTIHFNDKNCDMTGFVWQKVKLKDKHTLGLYFPLANDVQLSKIYEKEEDGWLHMAWKFEMNHQLNMSFANYPLDYENIQVTLAPEAKHEHVYLIPDLESYPNHHPYLLPGIRKGLNTAYWIMTQSFFGYEIFGEQAPYIPNAYMSGQRIDLSFFITLKRALWESIIIYLVQVFVVAMILFAVFLLAHHKSSSQTGYDSMSALATLSALFFATILSHIQLRSVTQVQMPVYLEYYYLALYCLLLSKTIFSLYMIFSKDTSIKLMEKVAQTYWPLLTGFLFVVTIIFLT